MFAVRKCRQMILQQKAFAEYDYPRIEREYGDFRLDEDLSHKHIRGLSKESGSIRGIIADNVEKTRQGCRRVLLPGEYNADKKFYEDLFVLPDEDIVTAGLGEDMDFEWNLERDPPEMGTFDYIVSQAMLEHLLNPYKHVVDLVELLKPGGFLILHTVVPGFRYHRFPIDCVRFFPDWFEEIGSRLGLRVVDRYIGELRICYTYVKE